MNIRWLVLFSAVAEEGSFTRAANRLNVAQPWVSAQIRKLEFELGVDLLERTSREMVDVKVVPDLLQVIALRARLEDLDGIPVINIGSAIWRGRWAMCAARSSGWAAMRRWLACRRCAD